MQVNKLSIIISHAVLKKVLLILSLAASAAYAHSDHHSKAETTSQQVLAPGYQDLQFVPPAPGSYSLPVLARAGNGRVVDADGRELPLDQLLGDKITALSFIYTHCDDINGCPLATFVFSTVQNRIAAADELRAAVKLISLSFDPANDTPAVMAAYGNNFIRDGFDWRFLTTRSERELAPILAAYNQFVRQDVDAQGRPVGSFSHLLRVFLIDKQKRIRNIYSMSFLHPDTMVNDIRTLLLEDATGAAPLSNAMQSTDRSIGGAGDVKDGYDSPDYRTHARSLAARTGKPVDLLRYLDQPPPGLPAVTIPDDNTMSAAKVKLGRRLFYDRRLSHNDTISCAMCHVPEQGFTSNELATAVGIEGRTVRRNTPTLYNVAYARRLFHDARETSLEQQIWGPLLARNEMGNPSVGAVLEKIAGLEDYAQQFHEVFQKGLSMETLGMALASYERTLISGNSPFDRWYYRKEEGALTPAALRGLQLFNGKAGCAACHLLGGEYALFTDQKLHNTGIGFPASLEKLPAIRNILIAPGTYINVDSTAIEDSAEAKSGDLGLYEITGNPDDRWKYKTPSLRNVALTAPYMHDGSLATLEQVVGFYNQGGLRNELLDPLIKPLGLSGGEMSDLVEFLRALTGDNINAVLSDAFAAPVGNVTDPSTE
jgi:cytochrome c peroxidase